MKPLTLVFLYIVFPQLETNYLNRFPTIGYQEEPPVMFNFHNSIKIHKRELTTVGTYKSLALHMHLPPTDYALLCRSCRAFDIFNSIFGDIYSEIRSTKTTRNTIQ